jgi:hypothetical protein
MTPEQAIRVIATLDIDKTGVAGSTILLTEHQLERLKRNGITEDVLLSEPTPLKRKTREDAIAILEFAKAPVTEAAIEKARTWTIDTDSLVALAERFRAGGAGRSAKTE